MAGALQYPSVVEEYLATELSQHRVAGPFNKADVLKAHISRFSVIPKGHRLINGVDLSHPTELSINDGISKHLCSTLLLIQQLDRS